MTFRLLGMSEEDRLAFEQATGMKSEAARIIVESSIAETERLLRETVREVQEVIGPHGSVTRLQAGGVRVARDGVSVFTDGVLKTTIEADGDFLAGSDITQPSTTSFVVFVNNQTYNNEEMGEGDLLIGDNSSGLANVKYDASEGQLQFRYGQTAVIYIDTDGSFAMLATEYPTATAYIKWLDSAGTQLGEIVDQYVTGTGTNLWLKSNKRDSAEFSLVTLIAASEAGAILAQFQVSSKGTATLNLESGTETGTGSQALLIKTLVSTTNALNTVLYLGTKSSGTVANGLGTAISFRIEDSAGNEDDAGFVGVDWVDKTSGSEDAELKIGLMKAGTLTDALTLDASGNVSGVIAAGTWTPTITNGTNVAASTAYAMNYIRVGNQVFFNGLMEIDTTAVGAFDLEFTLPISSTFTSGSDASGNATQPGTGVPNIGSIRNGVAANTRMRIDGYAQVNTNLFYRLAGGYIIK